MRSNEFGAIWRCAPTFGLRRNAKFLFPRRWKVGAQRQIAPNSFERIGVSLRNLAEK